MKLNLSLPLMGVGLALLVSGASAQAIVAPPNSPQSKFADSMADPQLLALREQLGEFVLAKYPDAKVDFLGEALVIRRNSEKSEKHLFTPFDDTFATNGIEFPADFDEFVLRVSAEDGPMTAQLQQDAGAKQQTYGTSGSSIYAWKSTRNKERSFYFMDIPINSWVYPTLHRLSSAGTIENLNITSTMMNQNRPFTAYELAVVVARSLDTEDRRRKVAAETQNLKQDFADLRMAFPTEYFGSLSDIPTQGVIKAKQDTQKQGLWLAFAYGKGVDAKFVADVKQIVENYANKSLIENSPAN